MFCNYCGGDNPNDALFCAACGKRIARAAIAPGQSAAPATPSEPAASRSASPRMQPLVGFQRVLPWGFALAAVGFAVFLLAQRESGGSDSSESAPVAAAPSPPASDAAIGPPADPAVSYASTPPPAAAAPSPPPAPASPLVGRWKTSLLIGDGYLTFTADGRVHIEHVFADEWAVYVFNDGDLMIQDQGVFDHDVTHWQVQVSGNTLSVIEPEGASHIYTRVDDYDAAAADGASTSGSGATSLLVDVLRGLAATPSSPETPEPQGGGRFENFAAIVKEAVNGAGAPPLQVSPAPSSLWLEVCAPTSVVEKAAWSGPDSAGMPALSGALRQFLASHRFRDVGDGELGSAERIIRVTEAALDQFQIDEVSDEATECRGDYETTFRVDLVAAREHAQPQADPGFGDLIGPGGFIAPLPNQ